MEITFSELKKKKVVNVLDGKELGKVTDLVFSFPGGQIKALIAGKKFLLNNEEYLINICCINKIGDDAVLVSLREAGVCDNICSTDEE